eukprot:6253497-Amphidinium_carterae.1
MGLKWEPSTLKLRMHILVDTSYSISFILNPSLQHPHTSEVSACKEQDSVSYTHLRAHETEADL